MNDHYSTMPTRKIQPEISTHLSSFQYESSSSPPPLPHKNDKSEEGKVTPETIKEIILGNTTGTLTLDESIEPLIQYIIRDLPKLSTIAMRESQNMEILSLNSYRNIKSELNIIETRMEQMQLDLEKERQLRKGAEKIIGLYQNDLKCYTFAASQLLSMAKKENQLLKSISVDSNRAKVCTEKLLSHVAAVITAQVFKVESQRILKEYQCSKLNDKVHQLKDKLLEDDYRAQQSMNSSNYSRSATMTEDEEIHPFKLSKFEKEIRSLGLDNDRLRRKCLLLTEELEEVKEDRNILSTAVLSQFKIRSSSPDEDVENIDHSVILDDVPLLEQLTIEKTKNQTQRELISSLESQIQQLKSNFDVLSLQQQFISSYNGFDRTCVNSGFIKSRTFDCIPTEVYEEHTRNRVLHMVRRSRSYESTTNYLTSSSDSSRSVVTPTNRSSGDDLYPDSSPEAKKVSHGNRKRAVSSGSTPSLVPPMIQENPESPLKVISSNRSVLHEMTKSAIPDDNETKIGNSVIDKGQNTSLEYSVETAEIETQTIDVEDSTISSNSEEIISFQSAQIEKLKQTIQELNKELLLSDCTDEAHVSALGLLSQISGLIHIQCKRMVVSKSANIFEQLEEIFDAFRSQYDLMVKLQNDSKKELSQLKDHCEELIRRIEVFESDENELKDVVSICFPEFLSMKQSDLLKSVHELLKTHDDEKVKLENQLKDKLKMQDEITQLKQYLDDQLGHSISDEGIFACVKNEFERLSANNTAICNESNNNTMDQNADELTKLNTLNQTLLESLDQETKHTSELNTLNLELSLQIQNLKTKEEASKSQLEVIASLLKLTIENLCPGAVDYSSPLSSQLMRLIDIYTLNNEESEILVTTREQVIETLKNELVSTKIKLLETHDELELMKQSVNEGAESINTGVKNQSEMCTLNSEYDDRNISFSSFSSTSSFQREKFGKRWTDAEREENDRISSEFYETQFDDPSWFEPGDN